MRKVFGSSDRGLVRKNNQDRFVSDVLSDELSYAVLCDGMGGENGGHIASELAVKFAKKALDRDLTAGMSELSIRSMFASIVSGANAVVYEKAKQDPSLKGMGTTMILAVISEGILYITSVGDSRVYLVDSENEIQLTKDHTVVQMMVDKGEITKEDALSHPKRHYITRAVGVSPIIEPDFLVRKLGNEQIVLLCSDGLYNYLSPGDLYPLLLRCVKDENVDILMELARDSGGADNITAVVMI